MQLPGLDGFAVADRLAVLPAAPAVVLISSRGPRLVPRPARCDDGPWLHHQGGVLGRESEPGARVTPAQVAGDLIAGLALLSAGVVAWIRARDSRTGPLLVLAGATWLAGDVSGSLVYAHRGPLVHALLTFPTGRTRSKPTIVVIALAYVDGLIPAVARDPWTTIALMAAVVAVAASRSASNVAERAARRLAAACAAAVAAPLVLASIGRLTGSETDVLATWLYEAAIVLTAIALAVDLLAGRSVRSATTGLVVHLADRQEPRALRDALSRAVGDPALEIAYRVDQDWVDEAGQPVRAAGSGAQRGARRHPRRGRGTPVAALLHDPAALRDATLAQSVIAAVRLVLANVRLQAEDAARMREVAASRRRLVEAGDEERRRLREQLRGGAEQMLAEVSAGLVAIAEHHDGATAVALRRARRRARCRMRGSGPLRAGCAPQGAHRARARRGAARPGRPCGRPGRRGRAVPSFPRGAGGRGVLRVLGGTRERRQVRRGDAAPRSASSEAGARLVVCVADDGRGGADPARGSGLRGLMDRVEALGGRLSVSSPTGAGTRIEAELPIGVYAS